jgi:hypothetical protein
MCGTAKKKYFGDSMRFSKIEEPQDDIIGTITVTTLIITIHRAMAGNRSLGVRGEAL